MDSKIFKRLACCCNSCKQFNDYENGGWFWLNYCWQEFKDGPRGRCYVCPQGDCAKMTADKWRQEISGSLTFLSKKFHEEGKKNPSKKAKHTIMHILRILEKCLKEWEEHPSYQRWEKTQKAA